MSSENPGLKYSVCLENMEELEKVFKRFDANGDGKISSTELGNVLNALGPETSREEIQRMMAEIDTDGDGFIDLQEFANFHRGGKNGDARNDGGMKELKDAFNMYDRNQNGLISVTELESVELLLIKLESVNPQSVAEALGVGSSEDSSSKEKG